MKIRLALKLWLALTLGILGSNVCAQLGADAQLELQRQQAVAFNATVTDAAILEFLAFEYEVDPSLLRELDEVRDDPERLAAFLQEYRDSHNLAGMKMVTLSGLSDDEVAALRKIIKIKRRAFYAAIDAERRKQALSIEQLAAIVAASEALIADYESLKYASGSNESAVQIVTDFPESLEFLKLQSITLYPESATLFLQRGIGKGVGFLVENQQGEWVLKSFNEYHSWDKYTVDWQ